ncbi:uncharacterized protein LOC135715881 [Ochlerotatus camptorhynchus]|uniref:uncharacterized protein LOC135715881 n=1 Tax=Ochlerotatus camptorhynchus TaxID=644619 RepID=UPI0031CEBFB8
MSSTNSSSLKQYLEAGNFLAHQQCTFRQGFETSIHFRTLGEALKNAYDSGLHTELLSLDKQLIDWSLNGPIVHFIQEYLSRVAVGNTKSLLSLEETGVPQGSVITVTLFLVAMNGVFPSTTDILIVITGPTPVRTRGSLRRRQVGPLSRLRIVCL